MTVRPQRDALHQAIDKLPEDALSELIKFVEYLQYKARHHEQECDQLAQSDDGDVDGQPDTGQVPTFKPVHFPEGILKGIDFSPEYIVEARKELWAEC